MFSERKDLAQLRGAPLGWHFTLFFVIHGLIPLGAGIAIAGINDELVITLVAVPAGALLSTLVVGFLVRTALRAKKRVTDFEEAKKGRRAQGHIVEVEQIGRARIVRRGHSRTGHCKARVRVRAWFEDGIPFELEGEAWYMSTEIAQMHIPGTLVWLGVHPSGQGPFFIHPESLEPQIPPGMPRGPQGPQGPQIHIQPTGGAHRAW